jgi:ABC-type branched-subunit amino acid transport system ATPase component
LARLDGVVTEDVCVPRPEVPSRSLTALSAVAVLGAVEAVQGYGVSLFTPEIAATLKVGVASVVSARVLGLILGAALPPALATVKAARRLQVSVWICRVAALLCAVVLASTGKVTSSAGLVTVLCLTALASAPSRALHRAMVVNEAAASFRVSALSVVQLAVLLAQLGLAFGVAIGLLTSWTKALETAGVIGVVVVLVGAVALRPNGTYSGADEDVAADAPEPANDAAESLPWKEILRAWRATPTLVGIGAALLVLGLLLVPFDALFSIYLHSHWHLTMRGTSTVFMIVALACVAAVLLNARRSDTLLVETPRRLATESALLVGAGSALLGVGAYLPSRASMVVVISLGSAAVSAAIPVLSALAFAVVPSSQRAALSAALASVLSAGGVLGVIYATSFENRHGPRSALVAMAVLGVVAAGFWLAKSTSLVTDQRRLREATAERRRRNAVLTAGGQPSLLECHGIDFSYGSLQVLFDVDFTIDEGEVVALLGTNGAGKSTLLKVISGIGLPQRGSVHLSGRDITYLDAEDRVRRGITQVPGGRAVFGSMTVVENLQSFGYTLGRDRRTIDEAIERCLEAFPRLAERRSSLAATLSGGEQQMLGLSKALILKPQLLLIDELSLGLAPIVVGPLLDMVRRINSDGTAVVIVEQSVNIALSLVDHAYFMEKGEIRFDGRASELVERQDLLRAVFLEGAAKGALS